MWCIFQTITYVPLACMSEFFLLCHCKGKCYLPLLCFACPNFFGQAIRISWAVAQAGHSHASPSTLLLSPPGKLTVWLNCRGSNSAPRPNLGKETSDTVLGTTKAFLKAAKKLAMKNLKTNFSKLHGHFLVLIPPPPPIHLYCSKLSNEFTNILAVPLEYCNRNMKKNEKKINYSGDGWFW